jgi:hypothetical protein
MKAVIVVKLKEGYLVLPSTNPFISTDAIQEGRVVEKSYNMSGLGTSIESAFRDEEERVMPTPAAPVEVKSDVPF